MSSYTEIDTALLDLDFTNPRIQNYLQNYPEESRSGELLAMLLGTGTDSCASLKESIKEHGGIINPIIVNHFPDGRYVVIEGNTRLQIYIEILLGTMCQEIGIKSGLSSMRISKIMKCTQFGYRHIWLDQEIGMLMPRRNI